MSPRNHRPEEDRLQNDPDDMAARALERRARLTFRVLGAITFVIWALMTGLSIWLSWGG